MNLARRLGEHFSTINSKGSNVLKVAFNEVGISNFKLTVIQVPNTVSYHTLLGLEQYYMLALNPAYCLLKVVDTGIAKGVDSVVFKLTEEQLLKARLETGIPVYLYNAAGNLLYHCLSMGEFKSLFTGITGHNIYYRYIDKDAYYKQDLSITSKPVDMVSLPMYDTEGIRQFLQSLVDEEYDYATRTPDPKSNKLRVEITGDNPDTILASSGRDAVNKLKAKGHTVSRKRIDKMVATAKVEGSATSQVDKSTLTLFLRD